MLTFRLDERLIRAYLCWQKFIPMKFHRISSEFGRQCQSLMEGYKKRLSQESSDYTLAAYCKEAGADYHKVIGWTSRHGYYYVRSIKSSIFGTLPSEDQGPCGGTSVQFMPGPGSTSKINASLKGFSIEFPYGVSLRIEECNCEGVITLLEI